MNNNFSRVITLLRKEKNLSQKQAADELGISQALLSHYEKGIRECGLDFVVKAADYYNVSCDYLLGRTAERSFDDSELAGSAAAPQSAVGGVNRKLIVSSLTVIYDRLAKIGNRRLIRSVTFYFILAIYRIIRRLYSANPDNPQELFTVPETVCAGYTAATLAKLMTDIDAACDPKSESYVPAAGQLRQSPEGLVRDYPGEAAAVFNVIQQAESTLNRIKR